ncbi:hypothetical protein [Mucilaginibacter kameinonensis]|uniref:hypothetical protein n=1 Tax=Mucilaginibacter kameinonensis TaxID=452286 RepID=UPI0013CE8DB3|nr:hypothetical protein [Mucilaginibacter kameinonensis]
MKTILKLTRPLLLMALSLLCFIKSIAQINPRPLYAQNNKKHTATKAKPGYSKYPSGTDQFKEFTKLVAQANVIYMQPKGFKEIPAPNDEDFSFDYALQLPGQDFEVWFQVKSQKQNYTSYEQGQYDIDRETENPDSIYINMSKAHATAFTGERENPIRTIPPTVLKRYKADAGKSYLLNLLDLPATKHYKYALLIALQRNHTGTIMAVCFTNDKGPEFFKNVDRASNCLKFKP